MPKRVSPSARVMIGMATFVREEIRVGKRFDRKLLMKSVSAR